MKITTNTRIMTRMKILRASLVKVEEEIPTIEALIQITGIQTVEASLTIDEIIVTIIITTTIIMAGTKKTIGIKIMADDIRDSTRTEWQLVNITLLEAIPDLAMTLLAIIITISIPKIVVLSFFKGMKVTIIATDMIRTVIPLIIITIITTTEEVIQMTTITTTINRV